MRFGDEMRTGRSEKRRIAPLPLPPELTNTTALTRKSHWGHSNDGAGPNKPSTMVEERIHPSSQGMASLVFSPSSSCYLYLSPSFPFCFPIDIVYEQLELSRGSSGSPGSPWRLLPTPRRKPRRPGGGGEPCASPRRRGRAGGAAEASTRSAPRLR